MNTSSSPIDLSCSSRSAKSCATSDPWSSEVQSGERFKFGRNWEDFLRFCSGEQMESACRSLSAWLADEIGERGLAGKTFLDLGCGSGIFSLAAFRLGARVISVDFDPHSIACATQLRATHLEGECPAEHWRIVQGSVLDVAFMQTLPIADIVYSWGVLHHTGALWKACEQAAERVADGGKLWLALYNDQGLLSRYWLLVKRAYNHSLVGRFAMTVLHAPYLLGLRYLSGLMKGRNTSTKQRGMHLWFDMRDWLGGLPFEVCKPEQVLAFYEARGFRMIRLKTVGGKHGCNEYLFVKEG